MKKYFQLFAACTLILSLSSCFELREEVDINKAGNGTYSMIVDLSKVKTMINIALATSEEGKDKNPFEDMDEAFGSAKGELNKLKGISNVQEINNRTDYIFGLKFDFEDVASLNNALRKMGEERGSLPDIYAFSKGTLKRSKDFQFGDLNKELSKSGGEEAAQLKSIFATAEYIYVVRAGKIKSFSNPNSKLSSSKKEVRLVTSFDDVIKGQADVSNTIKFK